MEGPGGMMEGEIIEEEGLGGSGVTLVNPLPNAQEPVLSDLAQELATRGEAIYQERKKGRGNQIRHWCFTLKFDENTKTPKEMMNCLNKFACVWVFQKEKAAEGYEHYQGYLCTTNTSGLRMHQVKDQLEDNRVHLETTRNVKKSILYCQKEDTRVEGPWTQDWKEIGNY